MDVPASHPSQTDNIFDAHLDWVVVMDRDMNQGGANITRVPVTPPRPPRPDPMLPLPPLVATPMMAPRLRRPLLSQQHQLSVPMTDEARTAALKFIFGLDEDGEEKEEGEEKEKQIKKKDGR